MTKKLPLNGFEWCDVDIFTSDFIRNSDDDGDKGYLLDVDIEYPKELVNLHTNLPFLPERRHKIPKNHHKKRISPINTEEYSTDVIKNINNAHRKVYQTFNIENEPENKLIATVQDKNNYVCNISTLKMALDHGLSLKKVHRVIEFNQSAWLKKYIDINTELRKHAKNDFEKDFFKLMNNSVFGKMIMLEKDSMLSQWLQNSVEKSWHLNRIIKLVYLFLMTY